VLIGFVGATFATAMNMLELFVAILQAYVFTLLSAMYFGQAVEEHHH
jgi:F-type H+-transporting ATPase subunit a